MSAVVQLNKF